jgi:hypothetical protein
MGLAQDWRVVMDEVELESSDVESSDDEVESSVALESSEDVVESSEDVVEPVEEVVVVEVTAACWLVDEDVAAPIEPS